MAKGADGQGELVLESRQLLLIFFVIAAFCGVFFALGYIVGRNSYSTPHVTQAASANPDAAAKPSPMPPAPRASTPPAADAEAGSEAPAPASENLNFYQSAEGKPAEAKLSPAESATGALSPGAPANVPAAATATPARAIVATTEKQPSAEPAGILVQISALTRREDANSLVALLKEKKLPVIVTTGPNDSLFHVAVGPYKNEKDAQQAKKILEDDGFRPIIKR